jgi:hypothetical protein
MADMVDMADMAGIGNPPTAARVMAASRAAWSMGAVATPTWAAPELVCARLPAAKSDVEFERETVLETQQDHRKEIELA